MSDKYLVLGILHSEASTDRTAIRDGTLHLDRSSRYQTVLKVQVKPKEYYYVLTFVSGIHFLIALF